MTIFEHTLDRVLDGTKTQTTRLVQPGDVAINVVGNVYKPANKHFAPIQEIRNAAGNLRFAVGQVRAVQPARGNPGLWTSPEGYIYGLPGDRSLFSVAYYRTGTIVNNWTDCKKLLRQAGMKPVLIKISAIDLVNVAEFGPDDLEREGFNFVRDWYEFYKIWTKMHDPVMHQQLEARKVSTGTLHDRMKKRPSEFYTGWRIRFGRFDG